MTDNEIEQKIKKYKADLKVMEINLAKDEQRLKTQQETTAKLVSEIKELYPSIDISNLDADIMKLETQLIADMEKLDKELIDVRRQIEENNK